MHFWQECQRRSVEPCSVHRSGAPAGHMSSLTVMLTLTMWLRWHLLSLLAVKLLLFLSKLVSRGRYCLELKDTPEPLVCRMRVSGKDTPQIRPLHNAAYFRRELIGDPACSGHAREPLAFHRGVKPKVMSSGAHLENTHRRRRPPFFLSVKIDEKKRRGLEMRKPKESEVL